ncbi:MAG: oligosaccharide flippase family protein [Candidatus Thiothrix putei]|uniref:Oligosaccharide flippase family protein n=1 Tax=Candidatus Thiothrix putei TaxID=3080811 RepID=A0AA95HEU5_9GAMM|nr:MAG: oligosaccharide flippase family protein [Candidatus Thiothrix putei]
MQTIKNVLIIGGGTLAAQILSISIMPVLTRIYTPDAFGVLNIFNVASIILLPLFTLTYQNAVNLPTLDRTAIDITKIINLFSIFSSIVAIFILVVLSIFEYINNTHVMIGFFVVFYTFFLANSKGYEQWLIRKHKFKTLAFPIFLQAILIGSINILLGLFFYHDENLIISALFGQIALTLMYFLFSKKEIQIDINLKKNQLLKSVAIIKKNPEFIKYGTPQLLLNASSQGVPSILLTYFFGLTSIGYFTLAERALKMPITLISASVNKATTPIIALNINNNKNLKKIIFKFTSNLAIISSPIFSIFYFFSTDIFSFIFGSNWSTSGEIAASLSIYLFFVFISPVSARVLVLKKDQFFLLMLEIFSITIKTFIILLMVYLNFDLVNTVKAYAIIASLPYIFMITRSFQLVLKL